MMSTANHLPRENWPTLWRKCIRRFLHLRVSQPEPRVKMDIHRNERPLRDLLVSHVISGRHSQWNPIELKFNRTNR